MPFLARCPYCGQRSRVPDGSLGTSGQCPRCSSFYTLTPEEEGASAGAGSGEPTASLSLGPLPPALTAAPATLADRHDLDDTDLSAEGERPGQRATIEPLGLAALLLGSAALLSASFSALCRLVMPLAVLGLLLGLAGLWRGRLARRRARVAGGWRSWRSLVPLAASLTAGAILVSAWLWPGLLGPVYQASRPRPTLDPAAMHVVPLPGSRGLESANPNWVDASQAALRQGDTLVRISRVWTGPAEAPASKKDNSARKKQYLFVGVQIFQAKALADKQARPINLKAGRPKLTDDTGQVYELRTGLAAPPVKAGKADLPVFGREQVFAFEPPAAGRAHLRIELPAGMWGGSGVYRFTIPATMIQRQRPR